MARVADQQEHTGGMIALLPRAADADRLAVDGGEDPGELHLTIAYLGDDVSDMDPGMREQLLADVARTAAVLAPVQGNAMSHSIFNPNGDGDRDPCAVYLVVGDGLPAVREALGEHDVSEHPMWLPHVTAGYGLGVEAMSYTGPVVFDRLRVALGGEHTDVELTGTATDTPSGPDPDDVEVKAVRSSHVPPAGVQAAAGRAVKLISSGKAGPGFTPVGRRRAADLAAGKPVSVETIIRMKAYFDRHAPDRRAHWGKAGAETPGYVAWQAWGGDAGYAWARRITRSIQKGAPVEINEGGDLLRGLLAATGVEVKTKVASEAGERRYGLPIGTELGQARNAKAQQAQDNPRAKDQYESLMAANPRDYRQMLDDLDEADLKSLTAIAYSFRSSNPQVVQARLALAGAMRRRGLDVNDYGGLGRSRTGQGKPVKGKPGKSTGKGKAVARTASGVRRGSADDRGVTLGDVSDKEWARLRAAGWKGKPGDGAERLYPPAGKSLDTLVAIEWADGREWAAEAKARTTTKPWESRKAQRAGKTIGAAKSDEKGGGDEYPVKTIGDIASGVKKAKAIKDPERRAEVMAHLRKGAKAIGGPAVNMVPKGDGGGGKGGFVPFGKGGKRGSKSAAALGLETSDDPFRLAAAIEAKVMSADPGAVKLRTYWASGPGRAKWRPGTPGDFERLRRAVRKYIPAHMLNGWVANVHKLATGEWPGKGRGHGKSLQDDLAGLEVKSVKLSKADLREATVVTAAPDSDDDAVSLLLDHYSAMADELTSAEEYEAAIAREVNWDLLADGTLVREDGQVSAPAPDGEDLAEDPAAALAALYG